MFGLTSVDVDVKLVISMFVRDLRGVLVRFNENDDAFGLCSDKFSFILSIPLTTDAATKRECCFRSLKLGWLVLELGLDE